MLHGQKWYQSRQCSKNNVVKVTASIPAHGTLLNCLGHGHKWFHLQSVFCRTDWITCYMDTPDINFRECSVGIKIHDMLHGQNRYQSRQCSKNNVVKVTASIPAHGTLLNCLCHGHKWCHFQRVFCRTDRITCYMDTPDINFRECSVGIKSMTCFMDRTDINQDSVQRTML